MAQPRKSSFASLVVLAPLLALGLAPGCGDEDRAGAWNGAPGDRPLPTSEPCEAGDSRDCHVTLNERNGILTCLSGTQVCEDAQWGECEGGTLSEMAVPAWYRAGGLQPQQAVPTNCSPANLCDPTCQQYDDLDDLVPDSMVDPGAGGGSGYDWVWGSLGAFPPGLTKKGMLEPCSSSADCQFDMYCNGPDSTGCNHSVCSTGAALSSGCESESDHDCSALVCAVDPTCCGTVTSTCTHDPCVVGAALTSGCNSCVTSICAAMPSCCGSAGGTWTQACADAVVTTCGNSCGCPTGWSEYDGSVSCYKYYSGGSDNVKWSEVAGKCTAKSSGSYGVMITSAEEQAFVAGLSTGEFWIGAQGLAGGWTWSYTSTLIGASMTPQYFDVSPDDNAVDAAVPAVNTSNGVFMGSDNWWNHAAKNSNSVKKGYVCESTSNPLMVTPWKQSCVDKVATVCHAFCNDPVTGAANTEQGECVQHNAGYIDPNCATIDLAVAPTCSSGGTYVIPVCNHGMTTVTASAANPIRIFSYQGNSSHYPSSTPDYGSGSKLQDTCYLEENIAPGDCVTVSGCDLDNNGGVIVNPQTAGLTSPAPRAECDYNNNWSLVKKTGNVNESCQDVPCGRYDGYYDELKTGSCSVSVPPQDEYEDPTLVTITHSFDDGDSVVDEPLAFTYVSSAGLCGTVTGGLGWYYDNPASPTTITLCSNACTRVKSGTYSSGSDVYVTAACDTGASTTYEQTIFYFEYGDATTCGTDRGVQWQDIGYTADIPAGTTVQWYVAAAADPGGLPGEPVNITDPDWHLAGTSDETETNCPTNSTPDCSIDVFTALSGLPDAQLPYIAIAVVLNPNAGFSAASQVTSFNVTYSCPFNQ